MRFGDALLDLLGFRRAVERLAWILHIDAVGDVADDLAIKVRGKGPDNFVHLVGGHREDDQVGTLDGFLVGSGSEPAPQGKAAAPARGSPGLSGPLARE